MMTTVTAIRSDLVGNSAATRNWQRAIVSYLRDLGFSQYVVSFGLSTDGSVELVLSSDLSQSQISDLQAKLTTLVDSQSTMTMGAAGSKQNIKTQYQAVGDPSLPVPGVKSGPAITASSDCPIGPFGHNQANANGVDQQTVTIQMVDAVTRQKINWNGTVLILPMNPIAITPNTLNIVNGVGIFKVGPTSLPSEYDIYIQIQGDLDGSSRYNLHLSFF